MRVYSVRLCVGTAARTSCWLLGVCKCRKNAPFGLHSPEMVQHRSKDGSYVASTWKYLGRFGGACLG